MIDLIWVFHSFLKEDCDSSLINIRIFYWKEKCL